jgi:hypothetical protein
MAEPEAAPDAGDGDGEREDQREGAPGSRGLAPDHDGAGGQVSQPLMAPRQHDGDGGHQIDADGVDQPHEVADD